MYYCFVIQAKTQRIWIRYLEIRYEIRRRLILHETEFTRERFFHFLLYRRSSILQEIYFLYHIRRFVSELMVIVCMLATTGNTSAVTG